MKFSKLPIRAVFRCGASKLIKVSENDYFVPQWMDVMTLGESALDIEVEYLPNVKPRDMFSVEIQSVGKLTQFEHLQLCQKFTDSSDVIYHKVNPLQAIDLETMEMFRVSKNSAVTPIEIKVNYPNL